MSLPRLLVINNNLRPRLICHRFWDTATYKWKHFIENFGQIAADRDMVTINRLKKVVSALSGGTIVDLL